MRCLLLMMLVLAMPILLVSGESRRNQSLNYALQGPIHTQLNLTTKLNDDPRTVPMLFIREQEGWLEFDLAGDLIEHGNVDSAGKLLSVSRQKYDAEGRPIEWTFTLDGKTTEGHQEIETLPSGAMVIRSFQNGQMLGRIVTTFNSRNGRGEYWSFGKNGELTSYAIRYRSSTTREDEVWGANGKLVAHTLERYDKQGELIQSLRHDAQGRVVSDLSFRDGVLSSWWQDPKCECTNFASFRKANDSDISYQTTKEGAIFKTVQHHQGRPTNHEIDDEELYDENNHLLERIAYTYERDEHGNWIRRIASVLDTKTGVMVPVREDVRTLTYY